MATTDKQRHELFTKAEEVLGEANAETLMSLLPPVGWAEVASKADLAALEQRIDALSDRFDLRLDQFADQLRAEFQRDLRTQLVTFLTANAVLLGLFTAFA